MRRVLAYFLTILFIPIGIVLGLIAGLIQSEDIIVDFYTEVAYGKINETNAD